MGTTANGLPYPEPSDDLRDGAAAVRALAEELDPRTAAQAAISLPLVSGMTGTVTVQRAGTLVVVSGDVTSSFPAAATTDIVGTGAIPAELRPMGLVAGATYLAAGYAATTFVRDDGSVGLANQTGAARARARFTVVYPYTGTA